MGAEKKGDLPLILFFYPRMIQLPCLCSVLQKKNSWNSETTLASPSQAASEAHHKDRYCKVFAENTYKEMSHPRPKETVLQRETFRTKAAEGISTNAKFSLKYWVITVFPTIPPFCHISIVQRIKNYFVLRFLRLKQMNHTQEIKGELRLSLIMGKKVKKRKKWFGG